MSSIVKSFALGTLLTLALSLQSASAYYDPGAQRWLNRDPLGEEGGHDLYTFVLNNPVSKTDATGETTSGDLCDPNSKNQQDCRQKDEPPTDNRTPCQKKKDLEKCQDDCMTNYEEDSEFCRSLRTKRARNYCWRQAAKRLAKCMHDCRVNNS